MAWEINRFDSNGQAVASLAETIRADLAEAIATRGKALMAVSGGNTPKPLFERLSQCDLPWHKVTVTLVDERWVDENDPDSNGKLARDYLLKDKAAEATFIGLVNQAPSPFEAEAEINQRLAPLELPFDVVILGMGDDGHTASFFPGAKTLSLALDMNSTKRCCAVEPPTAPHQRMTLTLPTVLNCDHLYLHIVGSGKRAVLEKAAKAGPTEELPIRSVMHQDKTVLGVYLADE